MLGSIWVCRHGERADAYPGWEETAERPHDPPLTQLGLRQAAASAAALTDEPIEAIYSSPFLRCMQTAAAVAKARGLRVRVEPGLSELLNAKWFSAHPVDAGMSDEALAAAVGEDLLDLEYRPVYDTPTRRAPAAAAATAESPAVDHELLSFPEEPLAAADRYVRTLRVVQRLTPFSLLVTHGFGVQAIAESCDGVEVFECDYCALTRLRRDQSESSDAPQGDEEPPPAADTWQCDVLCRSTHTASVAPLAEAGGTSDAAASSVPAEH